MCVLCVVVVAPLSIWLSGLPSARACNSFLYVTEPARRSTLYALVFLPLLLIPSPSSSFSLGLFVTCCRVLVCYRWTWRNILLFVSATRYCWERSITPFPRSCHKAQLLSQLILPPFSIAFSPGFPCDEGETRGEGGKEGNRMSCITVHPEVWHWHDILFWGPLFEIWRHFP